MNEQISFAYNFFLQHLVNVYVNKTMVKRKDIPLGDAPGARAAVNRFNVGNVEVTIIVGLAERVNGSWNRERAGWYVLCNGRTVAFADKTSLTGWGLTGGLAGFGPKQRGFVGIASFYSDNPEELPWTTTKRGLNFDSPIYQRAIKKMINIAQPVTTFLDNMYKSDSLEKDYYRKIADTVKKANLSQILDRKNTMFDYKVSAKDTQPSDLVKVQFMAKRKDIEKIRKCLNMDFSAARIGEDALKFYLKEICD